MAKTVQDEIERYLATGDSDLSYLAWPGDSFLERATRGRQDLRDALVAEVKRRQTGLRTRRLPAGLDVLSYSRAKLAPMVKGLFPRVERPVVLDALARSVVFVHRGNIGRMLQEMNFHCSAWNLAELYLHNIGADTLGDAQSIVGMGIELTSYVSMAYFDQTGPFEDFVIHEAAHVFHNCKRRTIGLPSARRKEWLLSIAYRKRELFAYSCEAYSRIHASAKSPTQRKELLEKYRNGQVPSAVMDQEAEHITILEEAVAARNGWKRILAACREDCWGAPTAPLASDTPSG
jgi:hypothetical protein